EPAALIDVSSCRTGGILHSVERARTQSKKYRSIDRTRRPHMSGRVAEIARRYKPVRTDLSLNAEVPLSDPHIRTVIIRRREAAELQPGNIARQILAARYWKRISTRIAVPGFIEIHIVQLHSS